MKQKLTAFWRYDQFPYLLSGTITAFGEGGLVKIKEYGNQHFRPLLILVDEEGENLKKELKRLKNARRDAEIEFKRFWDDLFSRAVPRTLADQVLRKSQ